MCRLAKGTGLLLGALLLLSVANSGVLCAQQPKIDFSEKQFYFGYIPAEQMGRHDYWIRNVGDAELAITQVKPNCSCTKFALADTAVAPGDSTRLVVYFDAERMFNRVVKILLVSSNDPVSPLDTIVFAAVVNKQHQQVKVEPQHLEFDPETLKSEDPARSFTVTNSSDKVVDLELVGDMPQGFDVSLSNSELPPGGQALVEVRLRDYPSQPGIIKNSVTLRFVLGEGYRVTVPITAEFAPLSP